MKYIQGKKYLIESVKTLIGYNNFSITDAEFIKSYENSLVFRYNVKYQDFVDWGKCWMHIAQNHTLIKGTEYEPFYIETHIDESRIESIHEIEQSIYEHVPDGSMGHSRIDLYPFKLKREEHCGGGTMSYCQRDESKLWPKYLDSNNIKRCCACNCRGPMIDNTKLTLD